MIDRLSGNKTYIVAGLTILWGVLGLVLGQLDVNQAIEIILVGAGTFGFRSALNKLR